MVTDARRASDIISRIRIMATRDPRGASCSCVTSFSRVLQRSRTSRQRPPRRCLATVRSYSR
jgi:hypothetical protein